MKWLARLFSLRSQSVKHASLILAITALLSNVLGLLRNLIFYRIIAPGQLDIYYASFRISDFIFNVLIFGAFTSAFIPVISELIANQRDAEAHRLTNQFLTWITIFFSLLLIILALVMPWLMHAVVPGFDPERLALTVTLSRFMLIQTLLFAWSTVFGSLLNSHRRFTSYSLAPLVYNLAIIGGGLFAGRYGVQAVTYGVLLGALCHLLIQYAEIHRIKFKIQLSWRVDPQLWTIFKLMIPRSISQGMGQLVLLTYTSLASTLQPGSIAIFNGMNDLQTTPTVIVANSLAIASFPALSAFMANNDWHEMNSLLQKILRTLLFALIPTVILGWILRAQLVRLYFGIGGASWDLTTLAINTFAFFLLGIVPAALVTILARLFYATKNTRTPMLINMVTGLVAIITAYVGIAQLHFTVATLAFAESLVAIVQVLAYVYYLEKHAHLRLGSLDLLFNIANYVVGSGLAAILAWATLHGIDMIYRSANILGTNTVFGLFIQLLTSSLVGILVYFGYSSIMSKQELQWLSQRRFTAKT